MGDTEIFGRTLTGNTKAMLLYAGNAICLAIGGAMFALDQKEWDAWWWAKRIGWMLLLLGQVCNTVKAFYSNPNSTNNKQIMLMKKMTYLLTLILASFVLVGCTTTKTVTNADGTTSTTKVYDAAKTERVKNRISNVIKPGVHFLLTKKKEHAPEIASYLGDVRNIFCKMVETKTFSHEFVVAEAEKLGTPLLVKKLRETNDDDLALLIMSGKDLILGLLDELLADVGTAQLDQEKWGYQVASLFCESFTTALKDEGY
jgi:hypothetical protein